MHTAVLAVGLFVFVAHLLDVLFERTRIPDILMLMILGLVAGPVLGIVDTADLGVVGEFLSVVTLLVILFESGLGLQLNTLFQSTRLAAPFALVSMAAAIALLTTVLHIGLGLAWWPAVLGGFIMGGTSSAVVIPMIEALGVSEQNRTVLTIESTITDVFCIIGTVGIATSLAAGEGVA
ncbi:MAG: cation:proton antiporter, partial [Myxococcota bacterium]|nr:cation:proton antiporter [Myxococcota bacterium]